MPESSSQVARLTSGEIAALLLGLAVLLATARFLGEVVRRRGQPAVLGEILTGLVLGPTLLGRVLPGWTLFPSTGGAALALDGLTTLSVALFLLVVGMEVDLERLRRQGRVSLRVSLCGMSIPFLLGFLLAWMVPAHLGASESALGEHRLGFALFFATVLAISSLPVIARILMDLNLFRTDLGMTVIGAAILQDLCGWIVFALILSLMSASAGEGHGFPVWATVMLTLGYVGFSLSVMRWLVHRSLPWIQAHASWPGGVLGFVLSLALLGAAFTEWIGIHAIFGTFMVGVAIGDSSHLRERTRATIDQFISAVFAPLFFASVGLRVDFVAQFDLLLVFLVTAIACATMIGGATLGGRWAGLSGREALAVGFGMNARGAMAIVLGLLALQYGVIQERMFVALVVMALFTSVISGPVMQLTLGRRRVASFKSYLAARTFLPALAASDADEAIKELCQVAAPAAGTSPEAVLEAVLSRERVLPSGLRGGVAVPSARIEGLSQPVVALGLSGEGLDFDAPDGEPARIVVLLLLPAAGYEAQWALLADIDRIFANPERRGRVLQSASYTELLAALNWGDHLDVSAGPRRGLVLVGAGPIARALARKAQALGLPVQVVDTNRQHCAAAQREGLPVVQGNATRDVVLFQAGAHQAGGLLALTPNVEVNAAVAELARRELLVPEVHALGVAPEGGAAFLEGVELETWDPRAADGEVEWIEATVEAGDVDAAAALARTAPGVELLPALLVRGDQPRPLHAGLALQPGDRLLALRHAPNAPLQARVSKALATCPVVEVPSAPALSALLSRAAEALAPGAGVGADLLAARLSEREGLWTPLLTPWMALARVEVQGEQRFALAIVRSREPVVLPGDARVSALIAVACSEDQRQGHLMLLAALARFLQQPDAEARWRAAPDAAALRALLLPAEESESARLRARA